MSGGPEERLVSPSDIADLAGVSRGAVSNWRKRAATFPKPVAGTPGKPLFSLQQVTAWLQQHAGRTRNPSLVSADRDRGGIELWAALNTVRDSLSPIEAADLVLDLTVARHRGQRAEVLGGPVDPEVIIRLESAIDQLDKADLADAVDFTLERLVRWQGKVGAEYGFVGSRTTALLADLASAMAGGVLYDPACGIGAALLEAVKRGARPDRIVGHDIERQAIDIARGRAELHDVAVELVVTDVIAEDVDSDLRADVILLEPPFGLRSEAAHRHTDPRFDFGAPPLSSAETAWMQHAVAHLSDEGRAYVLTPVGILSRGDEESEVRGELVRRGCVEAVVGLPGRLLPHTAMPLALWVLRRPTRDPAAGPVLLIDGTEAVPSEDPSVSVPVRGWLTDPSARAEVPHVEVPIADVLAARSDLTPQRWIDRQAPTPSQVATAYAEGWSAIRDTIGSLRRAGRALDDVDHVSPAQVVRVADLVEQGVLDTRIGRLGEWRAATDRERDPHVATSGDVRAGALPAGLPPGGGEDPEMTRPGDVLATTTLPLHALVDQSGGRMFSSGVCRLRVLDAGVLSPGYLALVLTGGWNRRFHTRATTPRVQIEDLEIPIVPLTEQHEIEQLAASMRSLHELAQRLGGATDVVLSSVLDAVRYNQPLTD